VQFGTMEAARNSRGTVTVCGNVQGRNASGAYSSMTRYIGVMMGSTASPEFVVVGIAGSPRERAEVLALRRESGTLQGSESRLGWWTYQCLQESKSDSLERFVGSVSPCLPAKG
jgi:hypothetical protein